MIGTDYLLVVRVLVGLMGLKIKSTQEQDTLR